MRRDILIVCAVAAVLTGCGAAVPEVEGPDGEDAEPEESDALFDNQDLSEGDESEYAADPRIRTALLLPSTVEAYPRGGVADWYDASDPDAGFVARVRVRNVSDETISIEVPQMLMVIRALRASNCRPSRGGLMPNGPSSLAPGESHTFSYRIQCRDMRTPGQLTFQSFIHFNQADDFEYPHPDSFSQEHRAGTATLEIVEPAEGL